MCSCRYYVPAGYPAKKIPILYNERIPKNIFPWLLVDALHCFRRLHKARELARVRAVLWAIYLGDDINEKQQNSQALPWWLCRQSRTIKDQTFMGRSKSSPEWMDRDWPSVPLADFLQKRSVLEVFRWKRQIRLQMALYLWWVLENPICQSHRRSRQETRDFKYSIRTSRLW